MFWTPPRYDKLFNRDPTWTSQPINQWIDATVAVPVNDNHVIGSNKDQSAVYIVWYYDDRWHNQDNDDWTPDYWMAIPKLPT